MTLSQKTGREALSADTRLELIRTGNDCAQFLCWRAGTISTGSRFTFGSRTYDAIASDFPGDVLLPQGVAEYESADILAVAISSVFMSLGGLTRDSADLAAYFSMATHFADCHNPSLRLVLSAAEVWDASRFLQILAGFCRHSITRAVFNPSELCTFPAECTPTILVADTELHRTLANLLEATQHRDAAVWRVGKTYGAPYSAVILDFDRGQDGAPISFCRLDVTPHSRQPHVDRMTLYKIHEKFQRQLLLYRLRNLPQVAVETFDPAELSGSIRALAHALGSCFPNNPQLQARIVEVMKSQQEGRMFDSASEQATIVLDALLVLCHQGKKDAHVGEITKIVNGILEIRGDGYKLVARRVGSILRRFQLGQARDSQGFKLLLSTMNQKKIHELGILFDVAFFKTNIRPCKFCPTNLLAS